MKSSRLFLVLALIFAALGFGFFSGIPATIFQVLSIPLLIASGLVWLRHRKIKKPVPSSYAASFRDEIPVPASPASPRASSP